MIEWTCPSGGIHYPSMYHDAYKRVEELENAISKHRDQKSDDRCWLDDQELYAVLKDGNLGDNRVGNKEQMLQNCQRYLDKRCSGGGWKTYAELEEENSKLREEIRQLHSEAYSDECLYGSEQRY